MKRVILVILAGLLLFGGASLAAQEQEQQSTRAKSYTESDYYAYSVPIEKIFQYRNGYVVLYRKSANRMARTYVPSEWFGDPTGKADMIAMGSGSSWPYMTVYEKSGAFSHIRLYVRRSKAHETWGIVPLDVNLDEYFEGVEDVQLEF